MFLGLEAIDEEGLNASASASRSDKNFEALEFARSLGISVAINIIADPTGTAAGSRRCASGASSMPEIVNITVTRPIRARRSGRPNSAGSTTRDYRLFDIQHAVLPTTLPLPEFYGELVKTQQVLNRKHLGLDTPCATPWRSRRAAAAGQTNFLRMLWKFNSVYNPAHRWRITPAK